MAGAVEDGGVAFGEELNREARQINARPELRRMHMFWSTGYPSGILGSAEPDYQV